MSNVIRSLSMRPTGLAMADATLTNGPEEGAQLGRTESVTHPALHQQASGSALAPARDSHPAQAGDPGRDPDPHFLGVDDEGELDDCQLQEAILVDGSNQISTLPLMDLAWTFQLHSSPSASKVIYLDFDGHTTTGTSWNASMGASFYSPAYDIDGNRANFSNEELSRIQQIWQRVAADYAPFQVDVTTQAPPTDWLMKSGSTDANYGMRVVITSFGPSSSTAGGIAKVNTFTASTDTPCFVYNKSLTGVAEAISHEVGHTLGLSHDGTSTGSYYYGHGSGETSWAPIMGVGYNKNVTQFDNGTYYGSNNRSSTANYGRGPNDLAVITGYNGFGYQPDLVGNGITTATPLLITDGQVAQFGRIETALDSDYYSFTLQSTGSLNLKFDPYWYRSFVDRDGLWGGSSLEYTAPVSDGNTATPYADSGTNLDLAVSLFSDSGVLLGSVDGPGLATSLNWSNLTAGGYVLRLDGVGSGNPTINPPTGYSDYGSIGNYLISGTIIGAAAVTTQLSTTTTTTTTTTSPTSTPLTTPTSLSLISPAASAASSAATTAATLSSAKAPLQAAASRSLSSLASASDPLTGAAGPTAIATATALPDAPLLASPWFAGSVIAPSLAAAAPLPSAGPSSPLPAPLGSVPLSPNSGLFADQPWLAVPSAFGDAQQMLARSPWAAV
ncbi:MAG: zinc-dependent metalloprotease family protein [Cyanobium sp.]